MANTVCSWKSEVLKKTTMFLRDQIRKRPKRVQATGPSELWKKKKNPLRWSWDALFNKLGDDPYIRVYISRWTCRLTCRCIISSLVHPWLFGTLSTLFQAQCFTALQMALVFWCAFLCSFVQNRLVVWLAHHPAKKIRNKNSGWYLDSILTKA